MIEDDEKEFDPSESEEFLKAINEVLDLPQDYQSEKINLDTNISQLIDIPDEENEKTEELSDSEFEAFDAALTQNLVDMFDEVAVTTETEQNEAPEKDANVIGTETDDVVSEIIEPDEEKNDEVTDALRENDGVLEIMPEVNREDEPAFVTEMMSEEDEFPEEHILGEQDIIDDINAALALQVNEMGTAGNQQKKTKKWLLTLIPLVGIAFLFTKIRDGMPKWLMGIRIAVFSIFAVFFIGTVATGGKLVYDIAGLYVRWRMQGEATTPTPALKPTGALQDPSVNTTPNTTVPDDGEESPVQPSNNPPRVEDHVINILLLGEEKIGSEHTRGRTDLIMIATLDTEQRTVKLTSIMRDILVAIPGHSDDRINSVYGKGGIELLKEVIALNFEIVPDGYMLVDFDSFEKVIDNLDGVTIELSKEEADYLNSTNYISNPSYRNVVPGLNKMNGNQALGYCRIRHVPTIDNVYSDFGRTSRQRVVLNAIFEKMKTKNLFQLAITADSCLPLVETDLTASQISDYLEKAVESKVTSFVQMRIPINGTFSDATYNGITDLIQINFPENIKAMHEFIFGDYKTN